MRVDDLRPDRLNGSAGRPAPAGRSAPVTAAAPVDPAGRGDSVVISAEARALAASSESDVRGALAPERLAELRHWLAAGGHNDPAVLATVAERILERGDLANGPFGDADR